MNTYETGKAIQDFEESVALFKEAFQKVEQVNPQQDPLLALSKMERIARVSASGVRLTGVADKILVHANNAQKLWLGDAIMDIVDVLAQARDLYKEEMSIAERGQRE